MRPIYPKPRGAGMGSKMREVSLFIMNDRLDSDEVSARHPAASFSRAAPYTASELPIDEDSRI